MRDHQHRDINAKSLRRSDFWIITAVAVFAAFATGALVSKGDVAAPALNAIFPRCNIKGNISIETGQRIYHVPGQKYYSETTISSRYGERWFCSEDEARNAGWRRSRV